MIRTQTISLANRDNAAYEVDARRHDDGGFFEVLVDYYGSRFGGAEAFVDSAAYARIEAERMFTFHLDPAEG